MSAELLDPLVTSAFALAGTLGAAYLTLGGLKSRARKMMREELELAAVFGRDSAEGQLLIAKAEAGLAGYARTPQREKERRSRRLQVAAVVLSAALGGAGVSAGVGAYVVASAAEDRARQAACEGALATRLEIERQQALQEGRDFDTRTGGSSGCW